VEGNKQRLGLRLAFGSAFEVGPQGKGLDSLGIYPVARFSDPLAVAHPFSPVKATPRSTERPDICRTGW
jgi:hypothetical protein